MDLAPERDVVLDRDLRAHKQQRDQCPVNTQTAPNGNGLVRKAASANRTRR
jgi:hypothetical protein